MYNPVKYTKVVQHPLLTKKQPCSAGGNQAQKEGVFCYMVASAELFNSEKPRLFEGIGRVFSASTNPCKVTAINSWLGDLHLINGSQELSAIPLPVVGEEPDWKSAVKVSRHKVDTLVKEIKGSHGGRALVFGSDVVFWLEGQPLLNLSRVKDLSGDDLEEAVLELQRVFSSTSTVRWDVAFSMSRKGVVPGAGLKQTIADSIQVEFQPIPSELIREIFYGNIPAALGRNTRLPLIDDPRLQEYFNSVSMIPIQELVDGESGELRVDRYAPNRRWTWNRGDSGFENIVKVASASVVGGMPRPKRMDQVLTLASVRGGLANWKLM